MSDALTLVESPSPLAKLELLRDDAEAYAQESRSSATRRAYAADWAHFRSWCRDHGVAPMPADSAVAAMYLTACAKTYALATIARRISAITRFHRQSGHPSPFASAMVQDVWQGIRRALSVKQDAKTPALIDDLRRILRPLGDSTIDVRDRALLLLGFAGAFRRSELCSLDVDDVRFVDHGLEIELRKSKTDQLGVSRLLGIPFGAHLETCPVRSLARWIERAGISDGPLFRAVDKGGNVAPTRLVGESVAQIVKKHAARIGLDPASYAGHSLRSGFVTSCALNGVGLAEIARQTGHRSLAMVMRYCRPADIWTQNAAERVGL